MDHSHALFPVFQVVLPDKFLIVPVSNVFQDISDEIVRSLGEESLQG